MKHKLSGKLLTVSMILSFVALIGCKQRSANNLNRYNQPYPPGYNYNTQRNFQIGSPEYMQYQMMQLELDQQRSTMRLEHAKQSYDFQTRSKLIEMGISTIPEVGKIITAAISSGGDNDKDTPKKEAPDADPDPNPRNVKLSKEAGEHLIYELTGRGFFKPGTAVDCGNEWAAVHSATGALISVSDITDTVGYHSTN